MKPSLAVREEGRSSSSDEEDIEFEEYAEIEDG